MNLQKGMAFTKLIVTEVNFRETNFRVSLFLRIVKS